MDHPINWQSDGTSDCDIDAQYVEHKMESKRSLLKASAVMKANE